MNESMTGQVGNRAAVMQPYFFPYIGYFQLIDAVDTFVVYDNIKYTKKGWINRNRILINGSEATFSVPLKKASDALDIRDRWLAADFNRGKMLNQLSESYRKAPHHLEVLDLAEDILMTGEQNLFKFLHASIEKTCKYLGITTRIVVSSTLEIDHSLQSQSKVIALCHSVGATTYINPIGGVELYSREAFSDVGIELKFIRSKLTEYRQFDTPFVPWLSIIDLMMFNSVDDIRRQISTGYDLI